VTNSEIAPASTDSRYEDGLVAATTGMVGFIHLLFAAGLTLHAAMSAMAMPGITAWDETWRVGPGLNNAMVGVWAPFLLSAVLALIALANRRPGLAMLTHVAGIAASIALCLVFISTYLSPGPLVGS
jgi:hypothetical protein